jgi:hypothetical protein
MGFVQQKAKAKKCLRCKRRFLPTGPNCKRCESCRREHAIEACKEYRRRTFIKKGYNQAGANNNAWKGGRSPQYYQKIAKQHHPNLCARCGARAALVHHKDENRSNSDPSNLEMLCKRCHQLEHQCARNLPKVVVFKPRVCVECTSDFAPTGPRDKRCVVCRSRT